MHGDLQPKNIHFASPEKELVKILDFGNSRRINEQHAMHGVFGTCYYLAPEVIEGEYSEKCDVWSLGVIMCILLSGEPPFNGETDVEVVERIKIGDYSLDGPVWDQVSDQAKNLIEHLLVRQKDRLSAQEALQHPWFKLCKEIEDQNPDEGRGEAIYRALANLQSFSSKNKVKQAALGFLIQHFLQMNEAVELQQVFKDLDTEQTGYLNKDELIQGYRKYYGNDFDEKEVENLVMMADSDGNGNISLHEFMMTSVNQEKFLTIQRLESIFNEIDIDKNHRVSLDELNQFLGNSEHLDKDELA